MASTDKVREATQKLLDLFASGNLPPAIARTTIRVKAGHQIPSDKWSLGNRLLMLSSDTEDARGFRQWEKVGRKVKKGAKAIYILGPRTIGIEDEDTGETKHMVVGFLSVPVFRYEDTEGLEVEYPDYSPPSIPPLSDVADHYGVKVRYGAFAGRYYGAYSPSKKDIILCSHDEEVFFHELAHAVHGTITPLKPGQDPHQEIVAETVAATLCVMYGFEGSLYDCKKYIEAYSGGKDPLRSIMQVLSDVEKVLEKILDVQSSVAV